MGQHFVDMSYSRYQVMNSDYADVRLNYSVPFVEAGWQLKIAPFVVYVNARMDLGNVGLGRAPVRLGGDLDDIDLASHRETAVERFNDFLDVSALSAAVAFTF